jgi:hypothetical protein
MVRDATGKDTAVYLERHDEGLGDQMKESAMIHWAGAEKDGQMWATRVHVGAMPGKMWLSPSPGIPTGAGGRPDFFQDDLAAEALSLLRAASSVVSVTGLRWRTFVP